MSEIDSDLSQFASQVLRPSIAASVLNTFRVLTSLIYGVFWALCLSMELCLHRVVGKRYMPTVGFGISLFLTGVVASVLLRIGSSTKGNWAYELFRYGPFALLTLASMIAFVAHYIANRRRFGTAAQFHSMDCGVPWFVAPPMGQVDPAEAQRVLSMLTVEQAQEPEPPAGLARRIQAIPSDVMRHFKPLLREHVITLIEGEIPRGPITWLAISVVEPSLIGVAGIGYALIFPGGLPFGLYLVLIAIGLAFKAAVYAADWRERIYSDMDARLEAEAMQNIREGRPGHELSRAITVPVNRAAVPQNRVSEPTLTNSDVGAGIAAGPTGPYEVSQESRDAVS